MSEYSGKVRIEPDFPYKTPRRLRAYRQARFDGLQMARVALPGELIGSISSAVPPSIKNRIHPAYSAFLRIKRHKIIMAACCGGNIFAEGE